MQPDGYMTVIRATRPFQAAREGMSGRDVAETLILPTSTVIDACVSVRKSSMHARANRIANTAT